MKTTNEILKQAYQQNTKLTFRTNTSKETGVKIVKLDTDDVENKEFTFETEKGERYTRFSNDIWF